MKKLSLYSLLERSGRSNRLVRTSSVTRRIFAMVFASDFILVYAFYAIMFGERGGVSPAGVGILLASWLIVAVVAEVPTGVIADKIPKKWSLVLGRLLQVLAFAVWLVAPYFSGYLAGFVLWGVGEAFTSGALQAYLYESLPDSDKQSFGKINARTNSVTMVAYATSYLLAFAVGPNYNVLLVASIAASLISFVISLTLPTKKPEVKVEVELRPKILQAALTAIRTGPGLKEIFIVAVIVQGMAGMMFEYLPVYYQQVGTPTAVVALLLGLGSGLTALIFWWMHHVEDQLARYRLPIMLVSGAIFVASAWGGTVVAVLGMFLFTRVLRMMTVSNESAVQHRAPDVARATVGSLYSFAGKLLSAGIITTIGFFAVDKKIIIPLRWSIVIMVVVFALCVLYFATRGRRIIAARQTRPL